MGRKMKKAFQTLINAIKTGRYLRALTHKKIQEKTILLESKKGRDLASNIFRLVEVLSKDEYREFRVYLAVHDSCRDMVRKKLRRYNITNCHLVRLDSNHFYRLLATAKYLVEDTTFTDKFIKRKEQVYLNIWHGTPWKKMGRDEEAGAYAIGNIQKNFLCADYLLYPNQYMKDIMFSAYMLDDLYRGKVVYSGFPRNSIFFDQKRSEEVRKELGINDQQVISYMPTWRGGVNQHNSIVNEEAAVRHFQILDMLLTDQQVFYVKFHLFALKSFSFDGYRHIRPFPEGYEPYEVLNASDVLVTDYSSVMFDYAASGKKIVLFQYDYDEYIGVRGLYTEEESIPFPCVKTVEELAEELNRKETPAGFEEGYARFRKRFCPYDAADATKRLAQSIFLGNASCRIEEGNSPVKTGKKRILVYSSGLKPGNKTTELLRMMRETDHDKYQYYFTFFVSEMKDEPERVVKIPEGTLFLPINGTVTDYTLGEYIAGKLFFRFRMNTAIVTKYIYRLFSREYEKHFGKNTFDAVVDYSGDSTEIMLMFAMAGGRKILFHHEKEGTEMQITAHPMVVRNAVPKYDRLVDLQTGISMRSMDEVMEENKSI